MNEREFGESGLAGRCPSGRSAAPTGLSRFASQAKPAAANAEEIQRLRKRRHRLLQALTYWGNLDENMHRPPSEFPLDDELTQVVIALHEATEGRPWACTRQSAPTHSLNSAHIQRNRYMTEANLPCAPDAILSLDGLLQSEHSLSEEQVGAIWAARHALLRERDKAAPTAKVWSNGDFLLFRRKGHGNKDRRGLSKFAGGQRLPRFRHKTRELAEAEAGRLLAKFPDSTFIIIQEVGRVKLEPASAAGARSDETPQAAQPEGRQSGPNVDSGDAQTPVSPPNPDTPHG
jgi:hypothetical protein